MTHPEPTGPSLQEQRTREFIGTILPPLDEATGQERVEIEGLKRALELFQK